MFEQILLLLTCYLLFFICYLIGCLLLSSSSNGIGYIFSGYGFIYIIFLFSALLNTNMVFYLSFLFLLGLFCYRLSSLPLSIFKYDIKSFLSAQIIISPFLIYTFFLNNLNWDDYATWLPNAYYIFEHGHIPKKDVHSIYSSHPAYPYAFPIFIGMINKINGHFYENIAATLNVIFLSTILTFSVFNSNIKFLKIFLKQVYFIPIILFAVLIMNSKGIFGAGPDLILCILACVFLFYDFKNYSLDCNKNGSFNFDSILFQCLIAISLIGTKQVGLYILLILCIGSLLTKIIFYNKINPYEKKYVRILAHFFVPIIVGYSFNYLWNFYAELEGLRLSFGSFGIESIRWYDLNKIFFSIYNSMIEKPYFLMAFILNLYFFITYKGNSFLIRYFSFCSLLTTLMLVSFLVIAYVTVFGEYEGNRAASFERYIAPAGFINLLSMLFIIDNKKYVINIKNIKTCLYPLIIIILYLGIAFSEKKRIIRFSPINYPDLINYFNKNFPPNSSINTFDFYSMGYVGHILTFKLHNKFSITKYDPLNFDLSFDNINKYLNKNINLIFGQYNDRNIQSLIVKLNLKTSNIINSKRLNFWLIKVDK